MAELDELDDRLVRDLARLRQRWDPPPGAEQHVRAALDAAIGGGPGGGPDGGDDGGSGLGDGGSGFGGEGLGSGGLGGGIGKLAIGLETIAATTVASCAVLLVLNLGVVPERQTREPAAPVVASETVTRSNVEPPLIVHPQPDRAPELPILVTPPVRVQRPLEFAEDPLTVEVALLEQARATDDLAARLQLLEQHRERFKLGVFALERDSLRVATLCELDRIPAARQAAEEFVLAHPRSPLLLRMRSACPDLDILVENKD
jgi:hypothetical protein